MATTLGSTNTSLAGLRFEVKIHEARNLVAKDSRMFGKGTSDPYVEATYTVGRTATKLGVTPVIKKTLGPKWEHSFGERNLGGTDAEVIMYPKSGVRSPTLNLALFDWDKFSNDDSMGMISFPFPRESLSRQWFPVGKGVPETKNYCADAKGEVLLSVTIAPMEMPSIVRGNVVPLKAASSLSRLVVGLGWDITAGVPVDLDVSCAAVGTSGKFLMEETVYFGNLKNRNGSVVHSGDEREGEGDLGGSGDDEQINFDLRRIPDHIAAYIVMITVVTPNMDFSRVTTARLNVKDADTGIGLFHFVPAIEGENTAMFVLRIARNKGERGWSLGTIGDGDKFARDFGSHIPEIRGYCRDLVPGINIDPNERVAVMSKGAAIRIKDYSPVRNVLPDPLTLGLAWDVTNGVNIDLDASAVCLDRDLNVVDIVFFKQLHSKDGAIHHSGDEREGDAIGDDEKIVVSLNNVDPRVVHISFILNSYSEQELDDIARASCHLFDPRSGKDLASYLLTNNAALDRHTALLLADVYRDDSREWCMRVLSVPSQGRTAHQCINHLRQYLSQNPAPNTTSPPETDIILNTMPIAVPIDEEINFSPFFEDVVATPIQQKR